MKIIVSDEKEKEELLRTCKYLHDFTVFFRKRSRKTKIEIISSFDNSIKPKKITDRNVCGYSLDFNLFPLLNLMVALHDADTPIKEDIINETIIIQEHKNKYQEY
jgi:hypothetical protein